MPTGSGPFPAVVLAHGYIDPAIYVRGQGMPRERRQLAAAGFIALHVDYRNHAASDDDPALQRTARLGYSVDVLNAVNALRATDDLPVDDDRIALMGRSMGGGVVYRALEMAPGLVDAGDRVRRRLLRRGGQLRAVRRPLPLLGLRRGPVGNPGREPGVLGGGLRGPALRPRHRAGPDASRNGGHHLSAALGQAHRPGDGAGRRRRAGCGGTRARATPSRRRSTGPWIDRSRSSTRT